MTSKKQSKPHTSVRKKASALLATSSRSKKAASKASKSAGKKKSAKKKLSERERQKLHELTLKMFQMVYDDYQQGKFHRIL